MKKQNSSFLVLVLAGAVLFSSCNKKSEDPPAPKTKTTLLTQNTWKFKSATANGSDASGLLQACQKDNIYTFLAAGTGSIDEGPLKCNVADPQTSSLTWNFATNETILHISVALFSNTSNDFNLISLTETELIVSTYYTPAVGPAVLVTITFQH